MSGIYRWSNESSGEVGWNATGPLSCCPSHKAPALVSIRPLQEGGLAENVGTSVRQLTVGVDCGLVAVTVGSLPLCSCCCRNSLLSLMAAFSPWSSARKTDLKKEVPSGSSLGLGQRKSVASRIFQRVPGFGVFGFEPKLSSEYIEDSLAEITCSGRPPPPGK